VAKCSKKTSWALPSGPAAERRPRPVAALLVVLALCGPAAASEATPAEFRGADLALGERLIREHRCSECHARRMGGDGSAMYRPTGRISRPAALLSMVEMCNTELNLQLFPEDVQAIAAVLQRDHYRFKARP
jgi:hypothetical protein